MAIIDKRITNLEDILAQTLHAVEQTSREMRDFKEITQWEMQEFKETSQREMQEFKQEMRASQKEMDRRMNRQWGEFSRIIGRMAEDLVAPSIPQILRRTIKQQSIDFSYVNVKKYYKNRKIEFDVVAGSGDYILINETKNKLRSEDIKHFAEKVLPKARDFFPEYADKKFIGAIASLYVNKYQVKDGEKRGIIVLGFGQDIMEVLNSKGFSPKTF